MLASRPGPACCSCRANGSRGPRGCLQVDTPVCLHGECEGGVGRAPRPPQCVAGIYIYFIPNGQPVGPVYLIKQTMIFLLILLSQKSGFTFWVHLSIPVLLSSCLYDHSLYEPCSLRGTPPPIPPVTSTCSSEWPWLPWVLYFPFAFQGYIKFPERPIRNLIRIALTL